MAVVNAQIEIFKAHTAGKERLTQFLMASAGAAMGFAITLQDQLAFKWPDILVIFAIVCFAASFWSGVQSLLTRNHLLYLNSMLLEDKAKHHVSEHAMISRVAHEQAIDPAQKKFIKWSVFQNFSLVVGAMLIMGWRIARAYPDWTPLAILPASFGA